MTDASPLKVGMLHYSCPPVVGGVEQILEQHTMVLKRQGCRRLGPDGKGRELRPRRHGARGTGYRHPVPGSARGEPLLHGRRPRPPPCVWPDGSWRHWRTGVRNQDVILAHNVLQMPFNLALTLALHRMADRKTSPCLVSWAHDSPYTRTSPKSYLAGPPLATTSRAAPEHSLRDDLGNTKDPVREVHGRLRLDCHPQRNRPRGVLLPLTPDGPDWPGNSGPARETWSLSSPRASPPARTRNWPSTSWTGSSAWGSIRSSSFRGLTTRTSPASGTTGA